MTKDIDLDALQALAECPFCGGDANAQPHSRHRPGCYFDVLAKLKAAPEADLSLAPELVAAWNRRADTGGSTQVKETAIPLTTADAKEGGKA